MPYSLENAGEGKYYVVGPNGRKSKKPLSHATATAQMRALYANDNDADDKTPNMKNGGRVKLDEVPPQSMKNGGVAKLDEVPPQDMKRGGKAKLTSKPGKTPPPTPDDMLAVNSAMGGQAPVPPIAPGDTSGMTPGYEDGGKFIQSMHMHKGGLHESLGIPEGQKIPESRITAAAKRPGKVGKQARLAEVFAGMHHGHAQHLGKKLLS